MPLLQDWSYKDIKDFYDRVRSVLNNLSSASLPDEYMDLQEKAPYAEMYAKRKVPNWKDLEDADVALFESAIVYKTASFFENLITSGGIRKKELPTVTIEYFSSKKIETDGFSLAEIADNLLYKVSGKAEDGFIGFVVTQ